MKVARRRRLSVAPGFSIHGLRFRRAAATLLMNGAAFCGGVGFVQYGHGS